MKSNKRFKWLIENVLCSMKYHMNKEKWTVTTFNMVGKPKGVSKRFKMVTKDNMTLLKRLTSNGQNIPIRILLSKVDFPWAGQNIPSRILLSKVDFPWAGQPSQLGYFIRGVSPPQNAKFQKMSKSKRVLELVVLQHTKSIFGWHHYFW